MAYCVIAPPGAGKTWIASTPWGRRFCLDTDYAVKLVNDEQSDKGARPEWVVDKAIVLCYSAMKERIRQTGSIVILTNLHHHFDDLESIVALPSDLPRYLKDVRTNRPDLSAFDDSTLSEWVANYEDFATRNGIRVERYPEYLSELSIFREINMLSVEAQHN